MVQEFEQEWTEDEQTEETNEGDETSQEETPTDEVEETPEETPTPDLNDDQKRNQAFADMRRQAQEAKKYQDFVARLAEQNGISPDDVLARFEERRLEEEAEKQQVPVEVLKRLQTLEQENTSAKEQLFADRFNTQVESVIQKHGATEDEIRSTFQYAVDNGIDFKNTTMTFEAVHRMAHLDTIITKEVEKARQSDLETKRQRQASATVPNGNSATQTSDELSDDDVDKILAKMNIRI
jgi:hypothetical protein